MHFAFTDDQLALTEAARMMLLETCPPESLRVMLTEGRTFDEDRWSTIVDMGLPAMLAPESSGGMGMELVDFMGIAEAAGYVALPEPLVELAGIAIPLLARLEDPGDLLGSAMGGNFVCVAHPANPYVAHADRAIAFILGDGEDLHLAEPTGLSIAARNGFDPFRPLSSLDWAAQPETRAGYGWGDILQRGAILAAAQLVGLGQRAIDMAVTYACDRTQFGKPIGSYQAVKHLMADAQVAIEFARPVVHAAAAELPTGSLVSQARASHAKIAAAQAADIATRNALQVFGAMGYTREADLHFILRRAHGLQRAWGTDVSHMRTIRERISILPTGADCLLASAENPRG